jgi:hypothetical protein
MMKKPLLILVALVALGTLGTTYMSNAQRSASPHSAKTGNVPPDLFLPPQYDDLRLYTFYERTKVGTALIEPHRIGMPFDWSGPKVEYLIREYKHDFLYVRLPNNQLLWTSMLDAHGHILPRWQHVLGVDADGRSDTTTREAHR